MSRTYVFSLAASRLVLRVLIVLNIVAGLAIAALLAASFAAGDWFFRAIGAGPGAEPGLPAAMRMLAVAGIASAPLMHVVLTRLAAIVRTVGEGQPFAEANAARLQTMAWAVLGVELLHLAVGMIASPYPRLDIDWNFSLNGWLAVLMLFILARVFATGAAMNEELEGTV